jgi:hypothetical protein
MRHEIVSRLVDGVADTHSEIRNDCVDYLTQCSRQDFTLLALERFSKIFNSKSWFSKDLVLLAGYIGNSTCKTTLEELKTEQRRILWHVHLALSRLGDDSAINWCLSQINRVGINDDVTYELLPGLVYTRQKRMFDFLVDVLNSDDKRCLSSNPDLDEHILCGYRVMEYLAPVVKDYPFAQHPSGDLDTDDYQQALLTVRLWFAEKKGKYEIMTDTF